MQGLSELDKAVPMVSVVVVTYQHAAFIEECVQGILIQQTTFPVKALYKVQHSPHKQLEVPITMQDADRDKLHGFMTGPREQ